MEKEKEGKNLPSATERDEKERREASVVGDTSSRARNASSARRVDIIAKRVNMVVLGVWAS